MRKRIRRDRRGNASVEFALVAMAFFMLLFGGFEFARYQATGEAVRTFAADPVRQALVRYNASGTCPSSSTVKSDVAPRSNLLAPGAITLSVACTLDSSERDNIAVSVSYSFSSPVPFLTFLGTTFTQSTTLVY